LIRIVPIGDDFRVVIEIAVRLGVGSPKKHGRLQRSDENRSFFPLAVISSIPAPAFSSGQSGHANVLHDVSRPRVRVLGTAEAF